MNNTIKQDITFKDITSKDSFNDGACSMENCNEWSTHYALVNLNGTKVFIPFCKKHAYDIENDLYTGSILNPNADGMCAEEHCDNLITKVDVLEINGISISIPACEVHARHIGNVLLRDGEISKIPTFKCIPQADFEAGMMFYCPHCHEWHKHVERNGHRIAHCSREDSPLTKTGYIIEMMPYEELVDVKETIELYLDFES